MIRIANRLIRAAGVAAAFGMALTAGHATAHHSSAMFDRTKTYVLKGTLIEYQFMAPHSWISVMAVKDGKGKPVRWDLEGSSAGRMRAQGITPDRLKAGDKITARTHPLRDGRNGGTLVDLVLADGTKVSNNVTKLGIGQ
ncbi:MAG: DUF6152 family protein [Caulobacteraceae bacterium]